MQEDTTSATATETASVTDCMASVGTDVLRSLNDGIGTVGEGVLEVFREHPNLGGIVSGGLCLGAAMAVGVGELTAAVIGGYIGYRMFARGESFTEAVEETVRARHGELRKEDL